MNDPTDHAARIAELETKVAFQDDTIEQLSNEIELHQASIAKLQQQLRLLGDRFKEIRESMPSEPTEQVVHEIPPHY